MDNLGKLDFSGVEETGLLTLYSKALESQSANPHPERSDGRSDYRSN